MHAGYFVYLLFVLLGGGGIAFYSEADSYPVDTLSIAPCNKMNLQWIFFFFLSFLGSILAKFQGRETHLTKPKEKNFTDGFIDIPDP